MYEKSGAKYIRFSMYGVKNRMSVDIDLDQFDFQTWHHICLVAFVTARQKKAQVFYDGEPGEESNKR